MYTVNPFLFNNHKNFLMQQQIDAQIDAQVERCHGNFGALIYLFLKNKFNLNSKKIFTAIEKSFKDLSFSEKGKSISLLKAYSSTEGCHIFSSLCEKEKVKSNEENILTAEEKAA